MFGITLQPEFSISCPKFQVTATGKSYRLAVAIKLIFTFHFEHLVALDATVSDSLANVFLVKLASLD